MTRYKTLAIGVLVLSVALASTAWGQVCGADHRGSNNCYGVSGGNVKDATKRWCCSGTLGSLVQDTSGGLYVLSNNHVLGLTGKAVAGDDISQPGLIDSGCKPVRTVADFTVAPPLTSNVDAAIAKLVAGTMRTDGHIMGLGIPCSTVRAPALGLSLAKAGRTSGVTTGDITSINATVRVRYSVSCGSGKSVTYTFTNQILTTDMSDGGDSGSLAVTTDTHRPVGLLYAGSSSDTVFNPVGEVLTTVGKYAGKSLSFVGTSCTTAAPPSSGPSQSEVDYVSDLVRRQAPGLMSNPAIIGVGVAAADDRPSEAVLAIYIDRTHGQRPQLPDRVAGARVKVIFTDPFVALGCCQRCK